MVMVMMVVVVMVLKSGDDASDVESIHEFHFFPATNKDTCPSSRSEEVLGGEEGGGGREDVS